MKETERVLWRLLSTATSIDETLSAAFAADVTDQIPSALSVSTLTTTEEKKSAIAYWDKFPLQEADEVLTWKEDLDATSGVIGLNAGSSVVDDALYTRADAVGVAEPGHSELDVDDNGPLFAVEDNDVDMSFQPLTPRLISGNAGGVDHGSIQLPQRHGDIDESTHTPSVAAPTSNQRNVAAKFGLSKEFQDTFLW